MNKKTIWITGGSTGIGKALAIKFAKEGWNVAISARRENLLDEILPKAFTNFEKLLSKYEGNFFLGERAFYCDFNVYHHVSLALLLDDKILDNFPKLKKFMSDFEKIQGILDYLESRPKLIGIGTWPKVVIDGIEYTSGTNPDYKYQ